YTVCNGTYNTSIFDLWTLGRQLLNLQVSQVDSTRPIPVNSNGHFTDTINYPHVGQQQSAFDQNFRNYLISKGARDDNGKLIDAQSIINIDEYSPADLKLNLFTPDELLQNGHSIV